MLIPIMIMDLPQHDFSFSLRLLNSFDNNSIATVLLKGTEQFFIMSEKLCLQWNDFKENINIAFGRLRCDKEFTDVTLACEDG